jgi:hypothetical protein
MTIYEKIKEFDEESMIRFLLSFAHDVINQFGRFQLPSEEGIREFLERVCPE